MGKIEKNHCWINDDKTNKLVMLFLQTDAEKGGFYIRIRVKNAKGPAKIEMCRL